MSNLVNKLIRYEKHGYCSRMVDTISVDPKPSTVDDSDIKRHAQLANEWWQLDGCMRALHAMNKLRVPFIRDGLVTTGKVLLNDQLSSKPLKKLKILDVGCGGGILCEPLARIGATVIGLDAGKDVISVATEHMAHDTALKSNITYVNSSIEDYSLQNKNLFDAVVLSEVLEHVGPKEQFLAASIDVLKPGGSLFITTLNKTYVAWLGGILAAEYLLKILPKGTHDWNKFISPLELQRLLEKNNCAPTVIHGMIFNVLSNEWHWSSNTIINYALHAVKNQL